MGLILPSCVLWEFQITEVIGFWNGFLPAKFQPVFYFKYRRHGMCKANMSKWLKLVRNYQNSVRQLSHEYQIKNSLPDGDILKVRLILWVNRRFTNNSLINCSCLTCGFIHFSSCLCILGFCVRVEFSFQKSLLC